MKLRSILALMFGFLVAGHALAVDTTNYPAQSTVNADQAPALGLRSASVLVLDQETGEPLLEKNPTMQTPIASITKLMTAIITLDAHTPLDERITISKLDVDTLKHTGSRLSVGSTYTREQLLNLALIASENRAAHALGRTYPGGVEKFVQAMNRKARALGMTNTFYVEPTGLSSSNQSTAEDLARLVDYAYNNYPALREITSTGEYSLGKQRVVVRAKSKKRRHASRRVYYRNVAFNNTNLLTRKDDWQIGLSKTGFINEAGHCLVMQAEIAERKVIIILLDSLGKYSRIGDANRIKRWLEESVSDDEPTSASPPLSRGT
jgi:D-alanyl-D-alanine endopeptidase (penicillin-binding protein 7)